MPTKTNLFVFRICNIFALLALMVSSLGISPVRAAGILHAAPNAAGTGDCSSWENACTLQTALTGAVSGDEIWVAAGTHKPTTSADRSATFQLKEGVAVYGGFAGTETARDQRNFEINLTILSGDLIGNDNGNVNQNEPTRADNSYHVVTGATGATLDGLTIMAGNANSFPNDTNGSGMYNDHSDPTLTNLTISGNSAHGFGGGMYNNLSNPALMSVIISGNSAGDSGGMHNQLSNPTLTNVTISNNSANQGGGMYNQSSNPTLTNVTISDNSAEVAGGMDNYLSSPALTNVTFSNNRAGEEGGGMYNHYNSNPMLTNVTFSGNSAYAGSGIYNIDGSYPMIRNAIFWGNLALNGTQINNSSSVSDSVVQGGCPTGSTCTNILTTDPKLGILANYGGFTLTIPLLPGSSAIDPGNDANCPASDQRGIARPQGAHCDIGSFEATDTVVLATQIGAHPRNPSYTTEPSFTFSGSSSAGGAVTFECSLDGASFTDCSSPQSYTGLVNGSYTFMVRAKDSLGNLDATPASYRWAINRTAGILHTSPGISGTGDCSSWENACALQTALTEALGGNELWVAAGMYKPTTEGDRAATFLLKDGVAVYGGFAGTETTRDQRDPAVNLTILSGDLNGDDLGFTNNSENVYHVVTGTSGAFLDGFTITAGNADGVLPDTVSGGGMYNTSCSNLILTNIIFSNNSVISYGGGMYNDHSDTTLTNVTFSSNSALAPFGNGGGMYNDHSDTTLTNITFSGNSAYNDGGGMSNFESNPTLTNITFSGNSAGAGGGMFNSHYSIPTLTNVTFSGNIATKSFGGGMFNWDSSSPKIRNTIFWGNTALYDGSQIFDLSNSVPIASDSIVQGGCPAGSTCTNIIAADPKLGVLGNYGGYTQTIPLLKGSSATDAGNDSVCPAADQRGVTRPQGAHCDIGAYEQKINLAVSVGGALQGYDYLSTGQSTRVSYDEVNNGPVKVASTDTTNIIAAERVNFFVGSTVTSYAEMMGLPDSQLDTTYWFPWYKNDSQISTQIRIGNVSGSEAHVHISIAGAEVAGSPYTLTTTGNGQSMRMEYAANNGPVKIWSDQNIVATERVNFFVGSTVASYSEMMGLPNIQLDTTYWFPWYKNDSQINTQLRIGMP